MTYTERWGHPRKRQVKGFHKAEKERKRQEAEERNQKWQTLSDNEKLQILLNRPGNCVKQMKELEHVWSIN